MKKLLLSLIALALISGVSAQKQRVKVPSKMLNTAIERLKPTDEITNLQNTVNPYVSRELIQNEAEIGGTVYDLQSNASTPSNRIEVFSDGTIGTTWTYGTVAPNYTNRGTAYNYFNGSDWGPMPTTRIEADRSGWPAYTKCGPTGEAFVSHMSGTAALNFYKRDVKGTGNWVGSTIAPPTGASGLLWPRMVSSGPNHEFLHVFALTAPTANQGTVYNGQDGAIVYTRSTDAGATWSTPAVLEGMGASDYVNFGGDSYSLSANGDRVVFLVTDNWLDMFVMTSEDNGATWEKTVIWEHPIPLWNNTPSPDTIYCPDGSGHAVFDQNGKLHVAFGVNRASFFEGATAASWYPWVDGLAYWNSDMPTWTGGDQVYALNPDLLWESGNLIGFMSDLNGNGTLDFVGFEIANLGLYYLSPTSMPQLVVDQWGDVFVVYSSVTETFDNGAQQFRHLWYTQSLDGGTTWDEQQHLSGDIIHILDETVFPSIAREEGAFRDKLHVIYQADPEPGLAVRGDEDTPAENLIYYLEIEKTTIGVENNALNVSEMVVSSAYPNPFSKSTSLDVTIGAKANISAEIYSITGQKVMEKSYGQYPAGKFRLNIDASDLQSGMYLIKVKAGEQSKTERISIL